MSEIFEKRYKIVRNICVFYMDIRGVFEYNSSIIFDSLNGIFLIKEVTL